MPSSSANVAHLFVDETGRFSERDEMRLVGGLLVIADQPPIAALDAVHAACAAAIGWPVRLHAFELVRLGYQLLWFACGGLKTARVQLPVQTEAQFNQVLADVAKTKPLPANLTDNGRWSRDAQRAARHLSQSLQKHVRAPSMAAVGRQLRAELLGQIAAQFRAWCEPAKAAFMVTGHVDDLEPPGMPAYNLALNEAVRVACLAARASGVGKLVITIADPNLGNRAAITTSLPSTMGGVQLVPSVVDYDLGPSGLWLADTLLSWCRPLPNAWPTPLDLDFPASRCLLAGTTSKRPHRSEDTFAKYLRAVDAAPTRTTK